MINGRYGLAGAGTQNAAAAIGGYDNQPSQVAFTEEYDGTTWAAGGALSIARSGLAGFGTQTAALAAGGEPSTKTATEEYNGTSWSPGGALITGRDGVVGAGTQNAGIVYGGSAPSVSSATEEYNGSAWATGGSLTTARLQISKGFGTQNAATAAGGSTGSETCLGCVEQYNGIAWTVGCVLPQIVRTAGAAGERSGVVFGGAVAHPATTAVTQEFDCSNPVNQGTYCFTKTL
jgi:hypothetical protein